MPHETDRNVEKSSASTSPTSTAHMPVPISATPKTEASVHSRHVSIDGSDDFSAEDDDDDAEEAGEEAEEERAEVLVPIPTGTSFGSTASRHPDFEVLFEDGDPEHPFNWSFAYRAWFTAVLSYATWTVVFYSTSYTSGLPGLVKHFDTTETTATLGLTSYLLGLALGSLFFAPMSEVYGRQRVYVVCLCIWAVLIIPCALSNSLVEIIILRFVGAFFGAAFITNGPGSVLDIAPPEYMVLCLSLWSLAPMNGPVTGPLVGGFVYQYMGWRWCNWLALILGGVAIALMFTVKETYAPVILQRKAARMRKEHDDPRYWCQYDQKETVWQKLRVNLIRPFVLMGTEPILWFLNLWTSVVYGILYLCFIAYPVVFSQHRGWSPGASGLSFLGIGLGIVICIAGEPFIRRVINRQPPDPETGKVSPEAVAVVMIVGGIVTPIGQLVFSWTCLPTSIDWAVPLAFSIVFGLGNGLTFIYGNSYISKTYGVYAASAQAGNALIRSVAGGFLPLAGPKMYEALGPRWAGTLLGLLEVVLIPIPFVFWRYGTQIRSKSRVVRQLREEEEAMEAKREKNRARLERKKARDRARQLAMGSRTREETLSEGGVVASEKAPAEGS